MNGLVDDGGAVDIVSLDFSKPFDTVSRNIPIENLLMYGLNEQTVRWTEKWRNGQAQRVEISGTKSHRWPVTSSAPQESTLGPILFNIFIHNLKDGAQCTLVKSVDDTKLQGVGDTPEVHIAIQWKLWRQVLTGTS